ncbi:hypothetical protein [Bradyrhizobium sp. WSM3983]|uniref:hypothetical protein n=1 Tax=Bradyrhizobium sp. WSM3983 TaxID=1038867 RepID=UPI0004043532|nr:hypothetical protein [Bradyrhizobium sp. WSM3983]
MAARGEFWIVEYAGEVNVAKCTGADGQNWRVLGFKEHVGGKTPGFRAVRKLDIGALLDAPAPTEPTDIKRLTDRQILELTLATTPFAEARRQVNYGIATMEQACEQKVKPDVYRMRRMEFETTQKVAKALGVIV